MKEDQKLVTIAHFEDDIDAEDAKQVLEEAGIKAVVLGQSLRDTSLLEVVTPELVELQVFEEDAERALEILEENFPAVDDDPYVDEEFDENDFEDEDDYDEDEFDDEDFEDNEIDNR